LNAAKRNAAGRRVSNDDLALERRVGQGGPRRDVGQLAGDAVGRRRLRVGNRPRERDLAAAGGERRGVEVPAVDRVRERLEAHARDAREALLQPGDEAPLVRAAARALAEARHDAVVAEELGGRRERCCIGGGRAVGGRDRSGDPEYGSDQESERKAAHAQSTGGD
jgi:hypothetical protein